MDEILLKTASGQSSILVGEGLTERLAGMPGRKVLLVDENVLRLHSEKFKPFQTITVHSGESNKTLGEVERIYRELVDLEIDRSSVIIGIGGGLTTDVAGYVASTYLRGIRFGFISTTLLGQVDASIGGKNGVNLDGYKNMIGVISQPEFIWCDYGFLDTLEEREYRSGIAEVIKYGAIKDESLLTYLDQHMKSLLKKDRGVLEQVISSCIRIKVEVVRNDERESGERRLLNFGHTVGHAIERNYGLLHGEAISIGMVIAARFSSVVHHLPESQVERLKRIIEKAGLPTAIDIDPEIIYYSTRKDKKKEGSGIHFIFLKSLGDAFSGQIGLIDLKTIIDDLRQRSK